LSTRANCASTTRSAPSKTDKPIRLFRLEKTRTSRVLRLYERGDPVGVFIEYNPRQQLLYIGGHWNMSTPIQSRPILLGRFCRLLGITRKDVKRALE
jgi:hypothetical protein